MNRSRRSGFTIVELLIAIVVIAILAAIAVISYGAWRRNVAEASVKSDLQHATTGLSSYRNFANDYPPNLGGIDFAASEGVALKLSTNAKQIRKYSPGALSGSENAQLFLNSCNALMPITDGSTVYNGSCTFAGINIHVKGVEASNVVWKGPTIAQTDIVLKCGPACTAAVQKMIDDFIAQGGTFPLTVPSKSVPLPPYDMVLSEGPATRFCLEAVSTDDTSVTYHTSSEKKEVIRGPCPADSELHYP